MKTLSTKLSLSPQLLRMMICGCITLAFALPNPASAQEIGSAFRPAIDPNRDGIPGIEMVQNEINRIVAGQLSENTGSGSFSTSEGEVEYRTISENQKDMLEVAYAELGGAGAEGSATQISNPQGEILVSNASPEVLQESVIAAIKRQPEYAVAIIEDLLRFIGPIYLTGPQGMDFISSVLNGALEGNPGAAFAISNFATSSAFLSALGGQMTPGIAGLITNFTLAASLVAQSNTLNNIAGDGSQPGSGTANIPFNEQINNEDPDEPPVTPVQNL